MRKVFGCLLVIGLFLSVGIVPVSAQGGETCVTINGNLVCGDIVTITAILQAMNGGAPVAGTATPGAVVNTPAPGGTPASTTGFNPASVDPTQWYFTINGVRTTVPMAEVDYAKGGFTSLWSILSNVLADPGKLIVDDLFPQNIIDGSGGAIWREDGGNMFPLNSEDANGVALPFVADCVEGSLISISAQHAHWVASNGMSGSYRAPDGSGTHFYIRCPNVDNTVGSDAGADVTLTSYAAGHAQVKYFSPNPPGGFISAEGALTALDISQGDHSCGSEGCISTYVITLDLNTGAYTVSAWDGVNMTLIATNWWVAQ